ncbi:hypothetical protein FEM48_Zijuj06G0043800 [Ziziphus jujuba var. spinosa]|uniref:Exocyst subunit Exo70 family protein n=1 Tax=Ziziphus jujuba var. spinosa TaxID=714518 RepID=A0A978V752_ZIZJJ|nr:hypothetical protein FEM48_Zijuj06G0043800 [Ziziphus jujuba var. spinosa]
MATNQDQDSTTIVKLEKACSDLNTLLKTSTTMEKSLTTMDSQFDAIDEALSTASRKIAPLQSLAMATKALDTRINRAVTPAFALLESFKLTDCLQHKLLDLSSKLSETKTPKKRLEKLLKYVDGVDQLNAAINSINEEGEPAIQKLQEVVEFLSRTKATGQNRIIRLRETLITLKALYETEVDSMKFEGLLDEALLNLQDEYESLLQQIKHPNMRDLQADDKENNQIVLTNSDLGTEMQVEVLRRISETLAANDCLDICIDIFVKVRYRRAAKALMRLNPEYLRVYTPEEIDEMEWESLETAIALWIQHFGLAVKTVLVSEKKLFQQALGGIMEGLIWPECFVKIADKIMAVFFRFGEGVARSSKEPEKLFKLLDMFDSLEKLKPEFSQVFEDEAGADICTRFRELEKLLIHASSKVLWEFGLQIEGNSDGFPPPQDGSVTKIVRYAINYLKYLATDNYMVIMAKVLQTEQIWKSGILSKPESEENLLREAISNVMEALQRNVESKRSRYRDKILPHIFAMNTYWYIYMRTKNTELGKLLGDQYLKKKYKVVAEESAYMYQKQTWGPLARMLDKEDLKWRSKEELGRLVREKVEAFTKGLDEILLRHKGHYSIPDIGLREQIREATTKLVVTAYTEFLDFYSDALQGTLYIGPESIQGKLNQVFDSASGKMRRRDSYSRTAKGNPASVEAEIMEFQRSRSTNSDVRELDIVLD